MDHPDFDVDDNHEEEPKDEAKPLTPEEMAQLAEREQGRG